MNSPNQRRASCLMSSLSTSMVTHCSKWGRTVAGRGPITEVVAVQSAMETRTGTQLTNDCPSFLWQLFCASSKHSLLQFNYHTRPVCPLGDSANFMDVPDRSRLYGRKHSPYLRKDKTRPASILLQHSHQPLMPLKPGFGKPHVWMFYVFIECQAVGSLI